MCLGAACSASALFIPARSRHARVEGRRRCAQATAGVCLAHVFDWTSTPARMPVKQIPHPHMGNTLLTSAVARRGDTSHSCGLVPSACLPLASGVENKLPGYITSDSILLDGIIADEDMPRAANFKRKGRHGDLFEDSDSDDCPGPSLAVDVIQPVAKAATPANRPSQHVHVIASFLFAIEAQQLEWTALTMDFGKQRAEVARYEPHLAWLCAALGAAA
jgi:hypothetical protein